MIQTTVLCVAVGEASAKIRTGPPLDDEEDYAMPIWAGVVPLKLDAGEPIKDPRLPEGIEVPEYARTYKRTAKPTQSTRQTHTLNLWFRFAG